MYSSHTSFWYFLLRLPEISFTILSEVLFWIGLAIIPEIISIIISRNFSGISYCIGLWLAGGTTSRDSSGNPWEFHPEFLRGFSTNSFRNFFFDFLISSAWDSSRKSYRDSSRDYWSFIREYFRNSYTSFFLECFRSLIQDSFRNSS